MTRSRVIKEDSGGTVPTGTFRDRRNSRRTTPVKTGNGTSCRRAIENVLEDRTQGQRC